MVRSLLLTVVAVLAVGLMAWTTLRPRTAWDEPRSAVSGPMPFVEERAAAAADDDPLPARDHGAVATDAPGAPESPTIEERVVEGRVLDPEGGPVVGARVRFGEVVVLTGADGTFRLPVPRRDLALELSDRRFRLARVRTRAPARGLEVRLDPGLSVSGRVTTPEGHPVEGLWVTAGRPRARTDESGNYRITGLEARPIVVSLTVHMGRVPRDDGADLYAGGGYHRNARPGDRDVDFVAVARLNAVRVMSADGAPIAGAEVTWITGREGDRNRRRQCGNTHADGTLEGCFYRADRMTICVSAVGYVPYEECVEAGPEVTRVEREIVLDRVESPAALELTASDELKVPLRHVLVTLLDAAGRPMAGLRDREVRLDEGGRGRLEGLPRGEYVARISDCRFYEFDRGYGLEVRRPVVLEAGGTTRLKVEIAMGGRIRVLPTNLDGEVTSAGLVRVDGTKAQERFGRRTKDGFVIAPLLDGPVISLVPIRPGEYRLRARRPWPDAPYVQVPVKVTRCRTTEVAVTLPDHQGPRPGKR